MNADKIMAQADFKRCAAFHGHVCGGLAIGYLAATAGLKALGGRRALDEELVTIVENDACGVDAIQVLTGCTFGKGNLIWKDYGKMAFTFFSRKSGRGVRLAMQPGLFGLNPRQLELFEKGRTQGLCAAEQQELQELGLARTREVLAAGAEKLFAVTKVDAGVPQKARIQASVSCARCGEPTMPAKMVWEEEQLICRGCLAAGRGD